MGPQYEQQFTAYIDLLGFKDFSAKADEDTRLKVLDFLRALSALRGEFSLESKADGPGISSLIMPAVSTFSDHIVISFPLKAMSVEGPDDEGTAALIILHCFTGMVVSIAAAALPIGFLIRGGAAIGNLYHSRGVVFGEALLKTYDLESSVAVYPRVVLSPKTVDRLGGIEIAKAMNVIEDDDGLYQVDYFSMMPGAERLGDRSVRAWYQEAVSVVSRKLKYLKGQGKAKEVAKWTWFDRRFREGMQAMEKRAPEYFRLQTNSSDAPR